MGIMPWLSTSATIVELLIIYLLSAPSLMMRRSARKLAKRVLKPRVTLREAKVVEEAVEAVEAVVAAEVEQVAETRGNVLLGMVTRKAPTLASLI
jgi:hypothetical protein